MRPAVTRFGDRMEAELQRHEGERMPEWTDTKFADLVVALDKQADNLKWALEARLKAKTPDELKKAVAEITKFAAHCGNYAMFIHDNAVMGRSP